MASKPLDNPLLALAKVRKKGERKLIGRTFIAREHSTATSSAVTSRGIVVDLATENDHTLLVFVEQYTILERVDGKATWVAQPDVAYVTFKAHGDHAKVNDCSPHGLVNIRTRPWDGFMLAPESAHLLVPLKG